MRDEVMIAALKRERAGYVARGLTDRVAEVDEQLKHYGYEGQQDPAPQGRKSPESAKQTAAKQDPDQQAAADRQEGQSDKQNAEQEEAPAGRKASGGRKK